MLPEVRPHPAELRAHDVDLVHEGLLCLRDGILVGRMLPIREAKNLEGLFCFWQSLRGGPRAIVRCGRKKNPPRGLHRVRSDTRAPRTLG